MKPIPRLVDYGHPLVRETVARLTRGEVSLRGKLEKLFYYVRDEIRFGFPKNGDLVKASDTIRLGMGQCNTKGVLFFSLCKAAGIPARIHFSLIKKEIQRGLFTGIGYALMPSLLVFLSPITIFIAVLRISRRRHSQSGRMFPV